jgi:tRNA pseudouridine synthase 10
LNPLQRSSSVLQEISLCKDCLEREGLKVSSRSASVLCDICGGVLNQISSISSEIDGKLEAYEFKTFLVGASIPQEMLDREDELRSRLKIKGKESIKSQITRRITKNILESTGKTVDYSLPDVTILVSMTDNSITINPRSVWLSARYRKTERGIAQRSSDCDVCNGLGCAKCNYQGRSQKSVQAVASAYFTKLFKAESCNFVWLGSEDENSLVMGDGRPFYIEVTRPKKRTLGKARERSKGSGQRKPEFQSEGVEIFDVQFITRRVTDIPQFEVYARVHMLLNKESKPLDDSQIRQIENAFSDATISVRLSRKFKTVRKHIQSTKVEISDDQKSVNLLLKCDGGIPLKKLVTGQDNSVVPNMSELLQSYQIDSAQPFDILRVELKERREKGKAEGFTSGALSEQIVAD